MNDFENGSADAQLRARFEFIKRKMFGEKIGAEFAGRETEAFVLHGLPDFLRKQADVAARMRARVNVALQAVTGDEFSDSNRCFSRAFFCAAVDARQSGCCSHRRLIQYAANSVITRATSSICGNTVSSNSGA